MKNIFLSFCGADRNVKNAIKDYLESLEKGYTVFHSDEFCASEFSGECIKMIDRSQIFVAIVSEETMSESTYCINEIIHARKLEKRGKLNILLFKLCDTDFTPEFEFQLNNRSDLNSLTRGTELGYSKLEHKIDYFLDCRENGAPEYEDVYTSFAIDRLIPSRDTNYRTEQVKMIERAFEESNIVFLHGAAGMGKMHTARAYYSMHPKMRAYRTEVCGNLRDMILSIDLPSLEISNIETDPKKKYRQTLEYLSKTSPNVLIVASGVVADDLDEKTKFDLRTIGAKMLILTLSDISDSEFPHIKIDSLPDEALCKLFFAKYNCSDEDRAEISEHLPTLINSVGRHTGALMFIADAFESRFYDKSGVIECIESMDFGDGSSESLAQKAILEFFEVDSLADEEKAILHYLSWTRGGYSTLDELRENFKFVGVRDLSAINSLKNKGYIETDGKYALSISSAVAIAAKKAITPTREALGAALQMLFADFDFVRFNTFTSHLCEYMEKYSVSNREEVLRLFDLSLSLLMDYTEETIDAFLSLFADVRAAADCEGKGAASICTDILFTMISVMGYAEFDEYFINKATEYGLYSFFTGGEILTEEELELMPPSQLMELELSSYRKQIISLIFKTKRSKSVGEEEFSELGEAFDGLLDLTMRMASCAQEAKAEDTAMASALPLLLTCMLGMKSYDGILSLYSHIDDYISESNPMYETIREPILYMATLAQCGSGNYAAARETADKLLSLDVCLPNGNKLRAGADLAALEIDIEEENYTGAKVRIERLMSRPDLLTEEEQLLLFSFYSHIQMFDGDWYAMRDYLSSVIKRYPLNTSGEILTLKELYEECLEIIEKIEASASASVNEREIVDATDTQACKKHLKKQLPPKVFTSCERVADKVMAEDLSSLSDSALAERAAKLSADVKGESEPDDDFITSAFAIVREAGFRVLGIKHHRIQIISAYLMVRGYSAQIRNGEGKTFTAVLAAATLALCGRRVDIISSSPYLSERDYKWMRDIYSMLGISVGHISSFIKASFDSSVLYCCAKSIVDRDSYEMTLSLTRRMAYDCAIVDEADLVLIDGRDSSHSYLMEKSSGFRTYKKEIDRIYRMVALGVINESDYSVTKGGAINIFESAMEKLSKSFLFGMNDISALRKYRDLLSTAIRVIRIWKLGEDYVIRGGLPYRENTVTGMSTPITGNFKSFLIKKERLEIEPDKLSDEYYVTYPDIVFKKYKKLICISGTAMSAKKIFKKFYGVDCIDIPTNKRIIRRDIGYSLYGNSDASNIALIKRVKDCVYRGQPVLIVTPDGKKQEYIERILRMGRINYNSISYKNDSEAAEVFAEAGIPSTVTVSTNIAGRGVDIILGGNPKHIAIKRMRSLGYSERDIELSQTRYRTEDKRTLMLRGLFASEFLSAKDSLAESRKAAIESGGLYVIGTFLMASLRHEEQLTGRAGRQGEPGVSEFIVSLDDDSITSIISANWRSLLEGAIGNANAGNSLLTHSLRKIQQQSELALLEISLNPYRVKSEISHDITSYAERILADESFAVSELLLAAESSYTDSENELLGERLAKLLSLKPKKKLFSKPKMPSLEDVLKALNPDIRVELFTPVLKSHLHRELISAITHADNVYEIESSVAVFGGISYSERIKKYEAHVRRDYAGTPQSMLQKIMRAYALLSDGALEKPMS